MIDDGLGCRVGVQELRLWLNGGGQDLSLVEGGTVTPP